MRQTLLKTLTPGMIFALGSVFVEFNGFGRYSPASHVREFLIGHKTIDENGVIEKWGTKGRLSVEDKKGVGYTTTYQIEELGSVCVGQQIGAASCFFLEFNKVTGEYWKKYPTGEISIKRI